jgi:hypothetical protein
MGDTASSASGGSEVDVDVVQGRRGAGHRLDPPSGTSSARCSLHGAPPKALPFIGRVGDLQPHLLAEHRQSSTGGYHTETGKIVTSEQPLVLACCLPGSKPQQSDAV